MSAYKDVVIKKLEEEKEREVSYFKKIRDERKALGETAKERQAHEDYEFLQREMLETMGEIRGLATAISICKAQYRVESKELAGAVEWLTKA